MAEFFFQKQAVGVEFFPEFFSFCLRGRFLLKQPFFFSGLLYIS